MNTFSFVAVVCCLTVVCGEYFDLMRTGQKEWRLVFKGVALSNTQVYPAYVHNDCSNRYTSECLKPVSGCPCCDHYHNNEAMENWSDIDQVAFMIYKDGRRVKEIIFDGKDSSITSWFDKSRIISTDLGGLSTSATTNFFSIEGDTRNQRRFFINQNYGGCSSDCGWFVAIDEAPRTCDWENNDGYPVLLYSMKTDGCVNWQNELDQVGYADHFVIYVKYLSKQPTRSG